MAAAGLASPGAGSVPNYDLHGHQHVRHPFKDKSHLLGAELNHPKWLQPAPAIRSRSELQQARKQGRIPDATYDFDGDGVVGQLDYFVGRSFDRDIDGHLNPAERAQADQALKHGFLDKFVRGLDATGPVHRVSPLEPAEQRGPKYERSSRVPAHPTRTDLQWSRKVEAKSAGFVAGERMMAARAPVIEPQPPNAETQPRACPISHIRERAEADHQASRYHAGLLPMNQPINPERELKTVGLERVEQPYFATRGQLLETRKEMFKRDSEDLRAKGEEVYVPLSVRRTEKEAKEFEFRKQVAEPMTLTRLQDARRREKIEYDMSHFGFPQVFPREYPRFSDRPDVPFWVNELAPAAGSGAPPPPVFARAVSEPVLKVTDQPFGQELRETRTTMPGVAYSLAAGLASGPNVHFGSNTVKRWTSDMLERGQGRNKPRLFDDIQPVRVGPRDMESLDLTSALEPIRTAAFRARAEERRKNVENPRRSLLWTDSPTAQRSRSLSVPSILAPGSLSLDAGDSLLPRAADRVLLIGPAKSLQRVHGTSEPTLRVVPGAITLERTDKPRDPRCFGNLSKSMSQTGVRSGGFQCLEWPPHQSQPPQRGRSTRGHPPRRSSADVKEELLGAA